MKCWPISVALDIQQTRKRHDLGNCESMTPLETPSEKLH